MPVKECVSQHMQRIFFAVASVFMTWLLFTLVPSRPAEESFMENMSWHPHIIAAPAINADTRKLASAAKNSCTASVPMRDAWVASGACNKSIAYVVRSAHPDTRIAVGCEDSGRDAIVIDSHTCDYKGYISQDSLFFVGIPSSCDNHKILD